MPNIRRPKRGSKGFGPRKRALKQTPRLDSWPEISEGPKVQGFAGYKAGMTHAFIVDHRKSSTTAGQEIRVPVTVLEVPPMKVAAVRVYENTPYGLKTAGEVWATQLDENLSRLLPLPKKVEAEAAWERLKNVDVEDVRVLAFTQPKLVDGVPKKRPELMELRIGGGTMEARVDFAKGLLGKDLGINDFAKAGGLIDVVAITKGKGFQGATKRWGLKLLSHKNSKHRRAVGNLGPKRPGYVRATVPQGGQMGYHQRTEVNKLILKVGESGQEVSPKGGFLHYGELKNPFVLIHGSVPGPTKRLVRMRDPVRRQYADLKDVPEMVYVSTESKQGA
jgi:large subunit ribosomal protein L3